MIKKPDAKKIIEKLKKPKRKPVLVTYRIDEKVKEAFATVCKTNGISAALVVEELIQGFIEEAKNN